MASLHNLPKEKKENIEGFNAVSALVAKEKSVFTDLNTYHDFIRLYPLPSGYSYRRPPAECRANGVVGQNNIIVWASQLQAGLRFPLDPLLVKLLKHKNIPLSQFHPNSIRSFLGSCLPRGEYPAYC